MTSRRTWMILIGLVLGLVCYNLPWYTHSTAGFTMNGFDLAEWSSLHPAVRSSSPPMLTSFLLRAPLLALVAALALVSNRLHDPRMRWVLRGLAAVCALRFVPPADFFSSATNDPNYRQMALLSALSFVAVVVATLLYRVPERGQLGLAAVIMLAGTAAGWAGLSRSKLLLDNFEIVVRVGPGFIGYGVLALVLVGIVFWPRSGWRAPGTHRESLKFQAS